MGETNTRLRTLRPRNRSGVNRSGRLAFEFTVHTSLEYGRSTTRIASDLCMGRSDRIVNC
jgi:hypothetical protein